MYLTEFGLLYIHHSGQAPPPHPTLGSGSVPARSRLGFGLGYWGYSCAGVSSNRAVAGQLGLH